MSKLPIYDRLIQRYKQEGAKSFDLITESTKINSIMRIRDPDLKQVKELIDAIILHHACLEDRDHERGKIPYSGKNLQKDICPKYDFKRFPPILVQILVIFISEIVEM